MTAALQPITSPEQLFTECRRGLFVVADRILHNAEDAEDCLQDAAVNMVRYWRDCRPETARSWAISIVRNQALSQVRGRRMKFEEVAQDPAVPSHERAVDAKLKLEHAITKLTPEEKEALDLWINHQRSVQSIGARLHSRQYRMLHRLRRLCREVC